VSWQDLLQSCVREADSLKLEKLVCETEDAIVRRFKFLSESPESDEFQALKQAAEVLLEIETKKLGRSDPAAPDSRVK
jgi:hypothetical protein